MSEEEIARAYAVWAAEMRVRGIHPDWILIWLGSNPMGAAFFEWVRGDGCHWPMDVHWHKPEDHPIYTEACKRGRPKWEAMLKLLEKQE